MPKIYVAPIPMVACLPNVDDENSVDIVLLSPNGHRLITLATINYNGELILQKIHPEFVHIAKAAELHIDAKGYLFTILSEDEDSAV